MQLSRRFIKTPVKSMSRTIRMSTRGFSKMGTRLVVKTFRPKMNFSVHSFGKRSFSSKTHNTYHNITHENLKNGVAMITLNRPKALNALCNELMLEVRHALEVYDHDDSIGCTVLTGSRKAFAAGADIKEMADQTYMSTYNQQLFSGWDGIKLVRKPVIAAVHGFALGGGCELAMMCDIVYAGESAVFGQPEITLGTIPGIGGTQRLTRAVGKAKAMELCLTGMRMNAQEAEKAGLVARVFPDDVLIEEAVKTGVKIASFSKPIVAMTKEMVNRSFNTTLDEGLAMERRMFYSTFGTEDQKIGMSAFIKKEKPNWQHK